MNTLLSWAPLRGGELALQLGALYPIVRAVVAYVPANVRYPACCGGIGGAAWVLKGVPLGVCTACWERPHPSDGINRWR